MIKYGINNIQYLYNNIKMYINQMIKFYSNNNINNKKIICMPTGYTEWDYLIQLHIR
jgi:hypothetical protein